MSDSFTHLRQRLPKPEAFYSPAPLSGGRPRTRRATPTVKLHRQLARDSYWSRPAELVWAGFLLTKLRHRAKTLGTSCDLSKQDMLDLLHDSAMICPAFDRDLIFGRGKGYGFLPNIATMDRRDDALPFTKSNMVVMSSLAKSARALLTEDEMIAMVAFAATMRDPRHAT